jgi:hypothetical protein
VTARLAIARLMTTWLVTGAGVLATAIAAALAPRAAAFVWLAAYAWGATLVLGALVLVLMAPVAPIRWLAGLLPGIRALADNTTLLVPLFLPVAFAVHALYPWTDPGALDAPLRHLVEARGAWQTPTAFLLRAVGYLATWVAISRLCVAGGVPRSGARVVAPVIGLAVLGVSWTLASFDWWMSLEVGWTSSIYGVYSFAGGFCAALAAAVLLARAGERRALFPLLPPDVYHALGRLLFAFVVFWAYLFWAQFLIVWLGGIPEEAHPLVVRLQGWMAWLGVLLVTHFALPFALLLGRAPKRAPRFLAAVCVLVLGAHAVDTAWLVLPALWSVDPLSGAPVPAPLMLALLLGPHLAVGGILALGTGARLGPVPAGLTAPTLAYRSP